MVREVRAGGHCRPSTSLGCMSAGNAPLWPRRLRWRLLGAWRWPLFVVVTIADGLIIHALPPTGARFELVPAIVICSFANLFLVGVIAPWLGRRTAANRGATAGAPAGTFPPADHG